MKKEVDERIVKLTFDNKQFEEGVGPSLKTIEKLKKALVFNKEIDASIKDFDRLKNSLNINKEITNLTNSIGKLKSELKFDSSINRSLDSIARLKNGLNFEKALTPAINAIGNIKGKLNFDSAVQSLSTLERQGQTFSLSGMSSALDNISNKFTTLGIMGVTTLQNLTNAAVNAGIQFAKSLTIDPVKTGLEEYETKMNAIQTILTNTKSKGTTIDDVNKALAELNEYADKTIYNFSEMTKNIGTFTAAGIDLKRSTLAIKGIANLAAGSGSTPIQASTAMYQLSQALAAGSVKLIDWNSVVNAGMGGELFQNALKETAKQMGVVVDASIPFRQTLESGWLTSEVLIKTLQKFATDETLVLAATQVKTFTQLLGTMKESVQSGWAVTWENIIGNKDQAAKTLTAINDAFNSMIGPMTDARNEALKFWNTYGGRTAIIDGLSNAFKILMSIIKPIGKAFREIFPRTTGMQLVVMSQRFQNFIERIKIGEKTLQNIKDTFKGLFAVLDIAKQLFSAVGSSFFALIKFSLPVGDSFLAITGSIGKFLVSIDKVLKRTNAFSNVMKKIGGMFLPILNVFKLALMSFGKAISSAVNVDTSGFDTFCKKLTMTIKPFELVTGFAKGLIDVFSKLADFMEKVFSNLQDIIINSFKMENFEALYTAINNGLFAALLFSLKKFIDSLSSLTNTGKGLLGGMSQTLDGVTGSLKTLTNSLKSGTLMKIAVAMALLANALFTISKIDSKKLASSLATLSGMFIELFGSMAAFDWIIGTSGFFAMIKITSGMIAMSTAVFILSKAMKKLGTLDWSQIAKGLTAVAGLFAILVVASRSMKKASGELIRTSIALVIFAEAINVLAKAVEKLGKFKPATLAKGLIGVGALIAGLALFMEKTKETSLSFGSVLSILVLAGALNVLAIAVAKIGKLKPETLAKGLGGVAIMLGEIFGFMKLSEKFEGDIIPLSVGLLLLGGALFIIAEAVIKMGTMNWGEMTRGLISMSVALSAITLAFIKMPDNVFLKSIALIDAAGAILMVAQALEKLAKLTWDQLARGLVALTASFGLIAALFKILEESDLVDSAAFTIIVGAIFVLAKALEILGNMSLAQIAASLLALGLSIGLIGAMAKLLTPVISSILALGAALALVGIAVFAFGAGIFMLGAGLTALAASGVAAATALVAIVSGIAGLIPFILKTFAEGIVSFITVLAKSADAIVKGIIQILLALIKGLATLIPKLTDIALKLVVSLLDAILKYLPKIIDTGMKILIAFLAGVSEHIGEVTSTAIELVLNFINGIRSKMSDIVNTGFELIITFINSLADTIRTNGPLLISAVLGLFSAVIDTAITFLTGGVIKDFTKAGSRVIQGFIKGMEDKIVEVGKTASKIAIGVLNAAKKVLGIKSPSREFEAIGIYSIKGFANGLSKYSSFTKMAATNVGDTAKTALSKSISNISDIVSGEVDMSPTIRPVLDLTDVRSGAKSMSSLFNKNQSLSMASASRNVSMIAKNIELSSNNEMSIGASIQKAIADLKTTANGQSVIHSGEITVRGINDMDQLVGVTKVIAQELSYGNRRIPASMSTMPSRA